MRVIFMVMYSIQNSIIYLKHTIYQLIEKMIEIEKISRFLNIADTIWENFPLLITLPVTIVENFLLHNPNKVDVNRYTHSWIAEWRMVQIKLVARFFFCRIYVYNFRSWISISFAACNIFSRLTSPCGGYSQGKTTMAPSYGLLMKASGRIYGKATLPHNWERKHKRRKIKNPTPPLMLFSCTYVNTSQICTYKREL